MANRLVSVLEGKVDIDHDETGIGMVTVDNEDIYNWMLVNGVDFKRVRITLEVLDEETR